MKKTFIIWVMTIIILCSSVYGVLTDGEVYYSLDDSDLIGTNVTDLTGNGHTGIPNNTVSGINGIINEGFNFSNAILSDNPAGLQTNDYTHSIWFYPRTITSGSIVTIGDDTVADHVMTISGSSKLVYSSRDGISGTTTITGATNIVANQWNHVVITRNSSNLKLKMFLNGELDAIGDLGNGTARYPGTVQYKYGERATTYFNGRMDEIGYWTRTITDGNVTTIGQNASGEVLELYNNGDGFNPYSTSGFFSIKARDTFDNSALLNLTANITFNNGSTQEFINQTGNFIQTQIPNNYSSLVNITLYSTNYFSSSNINYNVTSDLITNLTQSYVRFNATDVLGFPVIGDIRIDNTIKQTNDVFSLKSGLINVTFSNSTYLNQTQEFNITALQNNTLTIENVSDTIINISVFNVPSNYSVENFTANVYSDSLSYNLTQTTTNGYLEFNVLGNESYNITISQENLSTTTVEVFTNSTYFNVTVNVYNAQSVLFNIYDEQNNDLITTNMTVNVVGDITQTNTTTNGSTLLQLFVPGSYQVNWYSTLISDFPLRTLAITIGENSFQTINLYSLNASSDNINVVFLVLDENLEALEGATVVISRFDAELGGFVDISSKVSSSTGEVIFSLEDTNAFYRYRGIYNGIIEFQSDSSGTQFIDADGNGAVGPIPININTQQNFYDIGQTINGVKLTSNLTFVNTSNITGYFDFVSSGDEILEYCLIVNQIGVVGSTESCQTTSTPNIQIAVTTGSQSLSGTFTGVANFRTVSDPQFYVINSTTVTLNKKNPTENVDWIQNAQFFAMIGSTIALSFIEAPFFAIILLSIIITILGVTSLNISGITLATGMTLIVIGLLISSLLRRRR